MRIRSECDKCLRCLVRQAAGYATVDEVLQKEAIKRADEIIDRELIPGAISIDVATKLHDIIKRITNNNDPYRQIKDKEIEVAGKLFSEVRDRFTEGFADYLKLAALGNSIDFFKPLDEVKRDIVKADIAFTIDDSGLLESKIAASKNVLYLADNAGEVFFDLPLLRLMRSYTHVTYVIKEEPVQNDITRADIIKAGCEDATGEVMTTGTATPGVILSLASRQFIDAFNKSDFIFAKGMGYYESLEEMPAEGRLFFCLKAKCRPVADSLKVPLNSYVAIIH